VWFDFSKPDRDFLPCAGEMHGALSQFPFSFAMPVAGACALNGPYDTGLFVWTSAVADQVALFGLGFTEFGGSITTTFAGAADRFEQIAQDAAFFSNKHIHSARFAIAVAAGGTNTAGALTFYATFTTDFLLQTSAAAATPIVPGAAVFGTGIFGMATFASSGNTTLYSPVTITPSDSADGRVIQTMISETSNVEWLYLGMVLEVSSRLPIG
jgi:cyclophilin family peptidyl-prolyl cis-trans isomerase